VDLDPVVAGSDLGLAGLDLGSGFFYFRILIFGVSSLK
jgi:hypothetical protein